MNSYQAVEQNLEEHRLQLGRRIVDAAALAVETLEVPRAACEQGVFEGIARGLQNRSGGTICLERHVVLLRQAAFMGGNDSAFGIALERDQAARIEGFDRRAAARADIFAVAKKADFWVLKQG